MREHLDVIPYEYAGDSFQDFVLGNRVQEIPAQRLLGRRLATHERTATTMANRIAITCLAQRDLGPETRLDHRIRNARNRLKRKEIARGDRKCPI